MTNFDYLKKEPKFSAFADVAISAEKVIQIDPAASVINCRRAMEFAVKWMYSVDQSLVMPYQDNLNSLLHTDEWKDIVDDALWKRMDFIRRMGNNAAHTSRKITFEQAALCLQDLFIFLELKVFHKEYPHLPNDFAKVIDNHIHYAQSAIDEFSDPKKLPQIAISVDMLDTGIDVPEVLNLAFFKKVMSKAKFWQMIGRGTRLEL